MLARANRILKPSEFRMVMNTGERMSTKNFVFFYKRDASLGASRFGFVVSKAVGGAVVRNSVKRKLRAQSQILLKTLQSAGPTQGAAESMSIETASPFTGAAESSNSENRQSSNFWFIARSLPSAALADSATVGRELTHAFSTLSTRAAK